MIAIIIPFFQRRPGLLRAALESVMAQTGVDDVRVVVVDDASPVAASEEVASLGAARFPIEVIRQLNGGPASARNRGLDALGPSVDRVAFLDSDDVWAPHHLVNACRSLDAGHEFYFANLLQPGQDVGAFERAGRLDLARHPSIADSGILRSYVGDMFDQIISGNVIGTSTVVYDYLRFHELRFDESFSSAGEDYLFWIACSLAGARFAFSSQVEARYGFGVNVYAGSGWGTEGYMDRIQNEMRYRKKLLDFDLEDRQRVATQEKIRLLRIEFADDFLHRLSHRKPLSRQILIDQLRLDPLTIATLPLNAGQIVARRIRGRGSSS